jgi:hypothetical protein
MVPPDVPVLGINDHQALLSTYNRLQWPERRACPNLPMGAITVPFWIKVRWARSPSFPSCGSRAARPRVGSRF